MRKSQVSFRSTWKASLIILTLFMITFAFMGYIIAENSTEYPDQDVQTGWTTSTGTTHWDLIDDDLGGTENGDYVYTTGSGTTDEWNFTECPSDVQNVTELRIKLNISRVDGGRIFSGDVDWSYDGGATYNTTKNTGAFPTTPNVVTVIWTDLNLNKQECDDLQVRIVSNQVSGGAQRNHYIHAVNMEIIYTPFDTTPPTYIYDEDNTSGSIEVGETAGVSAYWDDSQSNLETAILRTNETGTWDNRSYYEFTGKPQYSNFTIDTTGQFGETICWVIWANDTEVSLNASMALDEHCFDVVDNTPPTYIYDLDNSSLGSSDGDIIEASAYWDDNIELEYAILRTNETGTWDNRSYYEFTGKPQYSNFTIDTTGQFGETICWVIWANDTSDNLNASMLTNEHCFDVNDTEPPKVTNALTNYTSITNETVKVNMTVTDNVEVDGALFDINSTNYTYTDNTSSEFYYNFDCSIGSGSWFWNVTWVNDTSGNENFTDAEGLPLWFECDVDTPYYVDDVDNSSGVVEIGDTVNMSVFWNDTYGDLDTALLRMNESGVWTDEQEFSFGSTPEQVNFNFVTSGHLDETICWIIYANDTAGNLNDSMLTDEHCFDVRDSTQPTYQYEEDNSTIPVTEGEIIGTSAYWDDNIELEYAILRTNETGTWDNRSYYEFTGKPQYSNFTIDTTGNAEETVCWVIWVNDTSGNLNDSMGNEDNCFTVNKPPQINSAEFNQTTINQYENVLFTVNVTDPDGISMVIATFRYPNLTEVNITLINDVDDNYTAEWNDTGVSGDYNVTIIYANDSYDSWNSTMFANLGFYVAGDAPPTATLNEPEDGNITRTTTTIVFNCSGYDEINLVNISLWGNWSGGWHKNETNTSGYDDADYYFTKEIPDGDYEWNCYACDSAGQCSFAPANYTFTVNRYPYYEDDADNSSGSVNDYETVNASAFWNDTYGDLDTAILRTNESGTWDNRSEYEFITTPEQVNFEIDVTGHPAETICWVIWANDTMGNLNDSMGISEHCFDVNDVTPPTYQYNLDNSSGSVDDGETVGTSVYWNDDVELDYAVLRTNETGTWDNRSEYEFGSKPEYSNFSIDTTNHPNETICWVIWANDTMGNLNDSMGISEHCFDVNDVTPPQLSGAVTNYSAVTDEAILLNMTVTDNIDVLGVWFDINSSNYSYSAESGGVYEYYFDCSVFGSGTWLWNATWATDVSGNENFTDAEGLPLWFECDVDNPSVSDAQINVSSPVDVGTVVKINATVTDANLDTVLIEVTIPGGSRTNISTSNSGDEYYAEYVLTAPGNWSFRFYANDSLGYDNFSVRAFAQDSEYNVTVEDLTDPIWRYLGTNTSATVYNNDSVNLSAQGYDSIGLFEAILGTNESGVWVNHSGVYGSSLDMNNVTSWAYSNFTWYNDSFIGQLWFEIWYRDNSSNWNVTDRYTITVLDSHKPNVNLSSPSTNTWNDSLTIEFAYYASTNDDLSGCHLYTNETGWGIREYNSSSVANDSNNYITEVFGSDGEYTWAVQCNDSSGNYNISENWTIKIDTTYSQMEIHYPQNATDNVTTQWINYTFTEINNHTCWYQYDSTNYTLENCDNESFTALDNQLSQVILWINDSAGNLNYTGRWFTIDTVWPNFTAVDGTINVSIGEGDFATASVDWIDNIGINYAVVRTNKSGTYQNEGIYYFSTVDGWANLSIDTTGHYGEDICWVQWAVDEGGNWNTTMEEGRYCFNVTSGVQKRSIYCEDCTGCSTGCSLTDSQCQDEPDSLQSYASGQWAKDSVSWDFIIENTSDTGEFKYVNLTVYSFRSSQDVNDVCVFEYSWDDGISWATLETFSTGTYPTTNTNRTYAIENVNSWATLNQTMLRIRGTTVNGPADTWTWYVDAVEVRISYDDTPPVFEFNEDNTSGSVKHSTLVGFFAKWYDVSSDLETAILRTNESGSWDNTSYFDFSTKPEYANFSFDTTGHAGETICWLQWANDTASNLDESMTQSCFDVRIPYLEVELIDPLDKNVGQNSTFLINATVYCRDGYCGNVSGDARHNVSGIYPDTNISTTIDDEPFYIMDLPNPVNNCTNNPLNEDDYCNITWIVNATGEKGSVHAVGVEIVSNHSFMLSNQTDNATITIVSCIVDITLNWDTMDFGNLEPGKVANAAPGNSGDDYNITINPITTCPIDLYINSTELEHETEVGYKIPAWNITFSNTTNDFSSGYNLTGIWNIINLTMLPGMNMTTYYWINTPYSITAGEYNGTITIEGVEYGTSP